MPVCSCCGVDKPDEAFTFLKSGPRAGYRMRKCKACHAAKARATPAHVRAERFKRWYDKNPGRERKPQRQKTRKEYKRRAELRKYGLSPEDYDRMLAQQSSSCAVCGAKATAKKRLAVDHCHHSGKVRGLLCDRCNMALGLLGDNLCTIQSLSEYLLEAQAHG